MAKISAHGEYKRFERGPNIYILGYDGVLLFKQNIKGSTWKRSILPKVEGDVQAFWQYYLDNPPSIGKLGMCVKGFNALPKNDGKPIAILED